MWLKNGAGEGRIRVEDDINCNSQETMIISTLARQC